MVFVVQMHVMIPTTGQKTGQLLVDNAHLRDIVSFILWCNTKVLARFLLRINILYNQLKTKTVDNRHRVRNIVLKRIKFYRYTYLYEIFALP